MGEWTPLATTGLLATVIASITTAIVTILNAKTVNRNAEIANQNARVANEIVNKATDKVDIVDQKADTIIHEVEEIHTLTNSNLTEVTRRLDAALKKISALEKLLRNKPTRKSRNE